MNSFRFFFIIAILSSLGCAKQSTLSGGEKDRTPPQALSYTPTNLSTNFSENRFEIEFDEFVQVKNLTEQLIVSPFLEEPPEYSLKGKTLIVEWVDTLIPNATYQFNFGSSVVDLNEANPNPDLLYVFSTGDLIDSLTLSGSVLTAKDNLPLVAASVMLYRKDQDSLPLTTPPDFFALTDEQGHYKITYLPEGEFKMFVLHEESPNYNYNGPPEIIGFPGEIVYSELDDSAKVQINIAAFIESDTTQYISATEKKDYGFYQAVFNLPTDRPEITFKEVESDIVLPALNLLSPTRDTLTSWVPLYLRKDPIEEIEVVIQDGELVQDTSFWYPEIDPKYRQKPELKLTSNLEQKRLDRFDEIKINLSNPLEELDTALVIILEDSVEIAPLFFKKSLSGLHFFIHIEKQQESIYEVILNEGAVKDLYGLFNDSTYFKFSLQDDDYYGNLTVSINDSLIKDQPNPIYNFTDSNGKTLVSESIDGREELLFEKLKPGKYGLHLVFDENGNGIWDTGSYRLKVQPEKQIFYNEEIEIRSNWDLEINWTPTPIPYGIISN
ncbi:MAG: Ig-like domain-containing protein [Flavobacteriales bacterium]|nr:Ig-like domain-containing protein [Flavobacteriales bacterium]